MHPDRFGDVSENHRLQVRYAFFEEFPLLIYDALGYPNDRLSSLLDGADEPLGVAQLLADELLGVRIAKHLLGQSLVDVEPLHPAVIVEDHEAVTVLDDVDVRGDGDGLVVGVGEIARRTALELLD